MINPNPVAFAILANSIKSYIMAINIFGASPFLSGFVHFLTKYSESLTNFLRGSTMRELMSDIVRKSYISMMTSGATESHNNQSSLPLSKNCEKSYLKQPN
jgi:hypothetical protein